MKRDLKTELEKIRESIRNRNRSFPGEVKGYSINSNKYEYLIEYGVQIVPLASKVNMHVAILQKVYKNKVPDDLESESLLFPAIISQQLDHIKSSSGAESVELWLKDRVKEIDTRIRGTVIAQHPNGGFNYLNKSNSNIPTNTLQDNTFLHPSEPPLKLFKKACTCQHGQFDRNHILPNGHAINCLYAGDGDVSFQTPILQPFHSSKETPLIPVHVSHSASNLTSPSFHKFSIGGDVHQLYPGDQFLLSDMHTLCPASGHQMNFTETSREMSRGIVHDTLLQTCNAKFPPMTSPKKCYHNQAFNKTHLLRNSSLNQNDNCQKSTFPKLTKFGKDSHSQSNTELSVMGKKCVATTSTSITSTSFANFIWHKPSPDVKENRNCTFISSTSTNIEDTNRIQQPDVLDLSVFKTEKVDDP